MSEGKQRKLLFILIDGIGDIAVPELGGQTPLQAANTPWLDRLAGTVLAALR